MASHFVLMNISKTLAQWSVNEAEINRQRDKRIIAGLNVLCKEIQLAYHPMFILCVGQEGFIIITLS